jgi:hypothetical protein
MGSIYRVVRGLINIVQTASNRLRSHTKYMVTRLLQSFMIYKLFFQDLSLANKCHAHRLTMASALGQSSDFLWKKHLGERR